MQYPQAQQYPPPQYQEQYPQYAQNGMEQPLKPQVYESPPHVRRDFIQKVYMLLSLQLFVTLAIGAFFRLSFSKQWAMQNMPIYYGALFCTLGFVVGMACCCQDLARTFPINFVLLGGFTLCQSVLIGFVCLMYTGESILLAFGATALVFTLLTAYACVSKSDFTGFGPYLVAAILVFMSFAIGLMIWSMFEPIPKSVRLVYAALGVLLFSFFIIHDTQLILGGSHRKYSFSIDDHVFAALALYMDIVTMFLMMLGLVGERN